MKPLAAPGRFVVGIALLVLALGASAPARAASIAIAPADTTVGVGDSFTLRVTCDAFPDLKACQVLYSYLPAHLQLLGVTAGDVFTGTGRAHTLFVLPDAAAPADTAWADCAMLDGSTAGPGVLLYLQFRAVLEGQSPIGCLSSDFRDSFNVRTLPACVPGLVRITGPTPLSRRTWGALKSHYR